MPEAGCDDLSRFATPTECSAETRSGLHPSGAGLHGSPTAPKTVLLTGLDRLLGRDDDAKLNHGWELVQVHPVRRNLFPSQLEDADHREGDLFAGGGGSTAPSARGNGPVFVPVHAYSTTMCRPPRPRSPLARAPLHPAP